MSSAPSSAASLELLLSDADAHRPLLETGLPEDAATSAPRPAKVPRGVDGMSLEAPDADPNDLSLQRWGVIYADSDAGRRALEAIEPLIAWRQSQQEAEVKTWAVSRNMSLQDALDWKNRVLRGESLPEAERPKYLLILGDLDEVSAELAHVLANGSFVGRIHFDDVAGYEAYAAKVVTWEQNSSAFKQAGTKFFVSQDGSPATVQGLQHLVNPCLQMMKAPSRRPYRGTSEEPWLDVADASDLLERCRDEQPSIFVSVCHGAGRPARGWKKPGDQRRRQGALEIGSGFGPESLLTAEQIVQGEPFLPGGIWFALTCFSAGTPKESTYHSWLKRLHDVGQYKNSLGRVVECLPAGTEKPFLAALPKAALQNTKGPLAMIGHLDLAWTYGFLDPGGTSRASRIFSALNVLASGSRAGVAHDALMRAYREVNDELLSGYQTEEDARVWNRPYEVDGPKRAHAFMLRNDLRGYVLLGDPAARLPLAGQTPTRATNPTPRTSPVDAPRRPSMEMENAVLEVLAKAATSRDIAKKYGTTREELDRWVEIYKAAGRAALENLK